MLTGLIAAKAAFEAGNYAEARKQLEWVVDKGADIHKGVARMRLAGVQDTASHPGAPTLGWRRFADLVADYPLPVYAVGGLDYPDLECAWAAGAHGIAAIRAAWRER